VADLATLPATGEAALKKDYTKLEYTKQLFSSPIGSATVTVKGPLGAIGALAAVDFSNPGSVINGLSIGSAYIPGIGPAVTGILGLLGGLFGGGEAEAQRHEQLIGSLKNITSGIENLSLQLSASLDVMLAAQMGQTAAITDFTLQLIGDKQTAFRYVLTEIARLGAIYLEQMESLHLKTETELQAAFEEAVSAADATISETLLGLQGKYASQRLSGLESLYPLISQMSLSLEDIAHQFLLDLQELNQIQKEINALHDFEVKPFIDMLLEQFRSRLLGRVPRIYTGGQPPPQGAVARESIPGLAHTP